ncbi:hypothetical protein PNEG_02281 [Pneumocystis murina B123]|uniref:Pre-mRNA-splicing factor SLU7 n=1 Tax=Pneumocystis murina (strain B123) TaxID=1069680 RepID=M7NQG1_PNEMU|nr:hypothetical protein PNEG_02281 [Pneumocystis murina B123]EMR09326.1 hypothetical protein PNEG_02281 [Pneumocystis murina B123]
MASDPNFMPMNIYATTGRNRREERWRQKQLEEGRKAGTIDPELDADGKQVNPHIPQFISKAPWYIDETEGKVSLRHQRLRQDYTTETDQSTVFLRGQRAGPAATKFRKGACENCGAMTHKTKECMERPRKLGARWTGKDIQADEVIYQANMTWDSKRDRWNGYDPREHQKIVEEYEKVEKAQEKARNRKIENISEDGYAAKDDDKYADEANMPGQKFDPHSRISTRNLRIREDTAKYLLNLTETSVNYDPKTRSMRDDPNKISRDNRLMANNEFERSSGEAAEFEKLQVFAWQAEERGKNIHLQANPTQGALYHKQHKEEMNEAKIHSRKNIIAKYGGEEHFNIPSKELLYAQTEYYVEYSKDGKVIKGQEKKISRSNYPEDILVNNHTQIFGSWWHEGQWGYACCHQFFKNSYCTGEVTLSEHHNFKNMQNNLQNNTENEILNEKKQDLSANKRKHE